MSLIELFDMLSTPKQGSDRVFSASPIPDYPSFRVAIDADGNPVLLLSVEDSQESAGLKNFRLKYLQLIKDVKCKITEDDETRFQTFTVITFISSDRYLQEYFLRISETLVKSLSVTPTQRQVIETLNKFVEVFRSLSDAPTKTVQGLWTELFLIDISQDPAALLSYWHDSPEDKFDFNAGTEKIEVKSSSTLERVHTFSSEQLNPPPGTRLLIASTFAKQSVSGQDIQDLIDSIAEKVGFDIALTDKLNTIACRTLGNTLEQSLKIKFDYQIAENSLRFYQSEDIKKIDEIYIPKEVSGVKYKSDLSAVSSVDITTLQSKEVLFRCF